MQKSHGKRKSTRPRRCWEQQDPPGSHTGDGVAGETPLLVHRWVHQALQHPILGVNPSVVSFSVSPLEAELPGSIPAGQREELQ